MGARHGACLAICPMVHVRGVFAPRGSVSRCAGCLTGIVINDTATSPLGYATDADRACPRPSVVYLVIVFRKKSQYATGTIPHPCRYSTAG
jgi:hypothetical protein